MTTPTKCFLIEDTGLTRFTLRRYSPETGSCPGPLKYHSAHNPYQDGDASVKTPSFDDLRWPVQCEHCDYKFVDRDIFQLFPESLYRAPETGALMAIGKVPVGAMWFEDWHPDRGPDGHFVVVKTKKGEWYVDGKVFGGCSRAHEPGHKCWTRVGEAPHITVTRNCNSYGPSDGASVGSSHHRDCSAKLIDGYLD
jgi:hypothetical protein